MIEEQKGQPGVSEDAIKKDLEQLQKETDASVVELETIGKGKEQELMTV